MKQTRRRCQIIAKILELCDQKEMNKTGLVYLANLNFHSVVPYIEILVKNDLLEVKDSSSRRYATTQKGRETLKLFKKIEERIPDLATIGF